MSFDLALRIPAPAVSLRNGMDMVGRAQQLRHSQQKLLFPAADTGHGFDMWVGACEKRKLHLDVGRHLPLLPFS